MGMSEGAGKFARFLPALIFVTAGMAQELGIPPRFPDPGQVVAPSGVPARAPFSSPSWFNTQDRAAVITAYQSIFVPSSGVSMGWTGNVATGQAGTTAQAYKDAVNTRINWFRAMAGIPALIALDPVYSGKDQQAALMMSANGALNHYPPSTWTYYTADGYEAAHNSNLCLGYNLVEDPGCVEAYVYDTGANNTAAGHRRWILYPQTQLMGTGDVNGGDSYFPANALWVFDSHIWDARPATRDGFVAWPPPGYVPYAAVYPRWSLSYPDANFSSATVTMSRGGVNIPVTIEPIANGYGENTLVWNPQNPFTLPLSGDTPINVTVSNVGGTVTSFSYQVIVVDPASGLSAPSLVSPVNQATGLPTSGTNLTWTSVSGATSYDVYFDTVNPPGFRTNQTGTSYATGSLNAGATYYWYIAARNASSTGVSPVWSFIVSGSAPPAPALASPANGATGVATSTALTWGPASGATSYDVYFGTSNPPALVTNTAALTYYPTLAAGTNYYWQVAARNASGSTASSAWSFTTAVSAPPAPGLASPANGATGVATSTALTWGAAPGATSYDVYFGTSNPPTPVTNTAALAYAPALAAGATYYWRVAAKNQSGTGSSLLWSFTTANSLSQAPAAPVLASPGNSAAGVATNASLSWTAATGATSYDLYFGTSNPPALTTNTTGLTYSPVLSAGSTYYWQVVAKNWAGTSASGVWSFTAAGATGASGLRFVPVAPCRVVDTRLAPGPLGAPAIEGGTARTFPVRGACSIPVEAQAYSFNVTVIPAGPLGYITLWPAGQPQPSVSTLNSLDGRIKANAAIVPAGQDGAVNVYVSASTEIVLDVNGYFVPATNPTALAFYPITPCRVFDTRLSNGSLGGPSIAGGQSRDFGVAAGSCGIPASAKAYAMNFTVVPGGPLGYLTVWPAGSAMPVVSTLNAPTGLITANAAIVPAGAGGAISVFASASTDVIADINGYFAPPGTGGLSFFAVTPCRAADTRLTQFAAPVGAQDIQVSPGACGLPSTAKAFSFNVTAVPSGPLGYLTIWPAAQSMPVVSALNAPDGTITANAAMVPATNGAVSVFVSAPSHVVLDTNGYFAP